MKKAELMATVLLVLSWGAAWSGAAFVNGVDGFDGPIRDITTWELYEGSPNQVFLQNDPNGMVHLDAYDYSPRVNSNGDYTTIEVTIGVGAGVRVEVTSVEGADDYGYFGLYLTDDARGSSGTIVYDDAMLMVQGTGNGNVIRAGYNNGSNGSHYVVETISPAIHPIGTTYVYQIERLSSTTARFSVFADDGVTPIGTPVTMTFTNIPDELFVAVAAVSGDALFDNATLFLVAPTFCGDMNTVYLRADLNSDCDVNLADFADFAGQWLLCSDPADSACDGDWTLPVPDID